MIQNLLKKNSKSVLLLLDFFFLTSSRLLLPRNVTIFFYKEAPSVDFYFLCREKGG